MCKVACQLVVRPVFLLIVNTMSSSDAADSAVTFAAMPAIGGASESSARQEDTNTSQSLNTTDTSSSDSGGRGRDRRVRALTGTPARVDEEGPQGSTRSRSPSRPSTLATDIQLASARTSPRGPFPRAMTPMGRQPGASRLLSSPTVGTQRANPPNPPNPKRR